MTKICECKGTLFKVLFLGAPGITLFIIIPSTVFYFVEGGWSYLDCVYYAYVSLTTIGYGDLYNEHHGKEVEAQLGVWIWAYQVGNLFNKYGSSLGQKKSSQFSTSLEMPFRSSPWSGSSLA